MKVFFVSLLLLIATSSFSQQEWEAVNFPKQDDLSADDQANEHLSFISPSKGWVLSWEQNDKFSIHRTIDKGVTWEKIYEEHHWMEGFNFFEMLNDSIGYMGSGLYDMEILDHFTYKTTDGGANWELYAVNLDSGSYSINKWDIVDDIHTLKGKDPNYYSYKLYGNDSLYTVNGNLTNSAYFNNQIEFENNGTANLWVIGLDYEKNVSHLYLSLDSGSTWLVADSLPLAEGDYVIDISFVDENNGTILTNNDEILTSKDAGVSWQKTKDIPFLKNAYNRSISTGRNGNVVAIGKFHSYDIDSSKIYSYDPTKDLWHNDLTTNLEVTNITFDGENHWVSSAGNGLWKTKNTITSTNILESSNTKVYPNPFNSILQLNSNQEISSVMVYNAIGEKVFEKNYNQSNNSVLNLSHLKAGIYFIQTNDINSASPIVRVIKK